MLPLFASLKHRPFLLLWLGQTTSRLGDQVYQIALAWWVLERTHSATAMGLVLIAAFAPTLVFVLVGGVVADRLPRLAIMLASDLLRGVLVAGIAALAFLGALPLGPIIGVSFCFGLVDAFFQPAYAAAIPQVVSRELLPSANGLRVISSRAMAIIGPALGAGLIASGGVPFAFAINGISFFVSAACLIGAIPLVRRRGDAPAPPAIGLSTPPRSARWPFLLAQFWRDFREGLAAVGAFTWVWLTIVIAGVANLIAEGATSVALPYYVQHTLGVPLLYGGLTAASAAGSILGAGWFGAHRHQHRGRLIYGLFILSMLVLAAIGRWPVPPIILASMLVYGLCATTLGLAWTTALQEYIPHERLGRVTSIDQLGSYIGIPLSLGLAGVATDRFGPLPVLLWGSVLAAAVVATGLLSRAVRELD